MPLNIDPLRILPLCGEYGLFWAETCRVVRAHLAGRGTAGIDTFLDAELFVEELLPLHVVGIFIGERREGDAD